MASVTTLMTLVLASLPSLVMTPRQRPQITQENLFMVSIGLEVNHSSVGADFSDQCFIKPFILPIFGHAPLTLLPYWSLVVTYTNTMTG